MEPTTTPVEESTPPAAAPPGTPRLATQRRRAIWFAGVLAVLAVVGSAAWLASVVSTERALHAVTSAAPVPVAAAPAPGAPGVAPGVAPEVAPEVVPEAALAAGAAAGGAALAAGALAPPSAPAPASAPVPPGAAGPKPTDVVAAQPASRAAHHGKVTRARSGKRAATRQVARRKPDSATFRRCPPLGRPGAVMCRWHICNGGAGKEAVCRPYLERQP